MSEPAVLLAVKEAADYLAVSRRTVYRLVKDEKLTILKVRGGSRIKRAELDRYLRDAERRVA